MSRQPSMVGRFEITGPARPTRTRAAGLLDLLGATIAAMLVIPQPVVRAALMSDGATAASIAAFVGVLLLSVFVFLFVYMAFSAVTWGRTLAMYLLDLGLDTPTKPTAREAILWALGWVCAAVPALFGIGVAFDPESGWPAKLSGARTGSTSA